MKYAKASLIKGRRRRSARLLCLGLLLMSCATVGGSGVFGLSAQEGGLDAEALARQAWEAVQDFQRDGGQDGGPEHPGAVYGPRLWQMARSGTAGEERFKAAEEAIHLMIHAGSFDVIEQWLNQLQGGDELWASVLRRLPEAGGHPLGNHMATRQLRRLQASRAEEMAVSAPRLSFLLANLREMAGYGLEARQLVQRLIEQYPASQEALSARRSWEREGVLGAGDTVPPFEVTTVEERTLSSKWLQGKVVLLDFWSTTCGICLRDMPSIRAVHERFGEAGFEVVGVAFDQDPQAVRRAAQDKGAAWPQVLASQAGDLPARMGAGGTPYYVLIDTRGRIVSAGIGIRFLEGRVEELLTRRVSQAR